MIREGKLGPESLCWRPGLEDWVALRGVEEFAALLTPGGVTSAPAPPERAKGGWAFFKSALRKGADEAARTAKRARLRLKMASLEKDCNEVFREMGKGLYEKGAGYLSDESYAANIERLRSLRARIQELQGQIEQLK